MQTYTHLDYTFDASAKQVTLLNSDLSDWVGSIEQIKAIVNLTNTARPMIYYPLDSQKGAVLVGNVLTLNYNTTNMADMDILEIIIDKISIEVINENLDIPLSDLLTELTSIEGKDFATQTTLALIKAKTDNIPALGQALAAASTPVVLTAIQQAALTPPAAITGFATESTLGTRLSESDFDTKVGSLTETAPASDTASSGLNGRLQRIAQRLTTLIASTLTTKETRSTTPAQTSVSVTSSNTSILASNSNRLGATIYNEGAQTCYLKLGATASTTSYTLKLVTDAYYEVPFNYTGAIDGITSSSTAQLRITELT